jgi:hypothetical protein
MDGDDLMGLIVIAAIAVVAILLLGKGIFGSSKSNGRGSPYSPAMLATAAGQGVSAIEKAAANSASQLGRLAATVESNILHGAAHVYSTAPSSRNTSKSYSQAVQSQLSAGIKTGEGAVTGPAATVGAGIGVAPLDLLGAFVQGVSSSGNAVGKLPGVKQAASTGGDLVNTLGNAVSTSARALGTAAASVGTGFHDATKWLGGIL